MNILRYVIPSSKVLPSALLVLFLLLALARSGSVSCQSMGGARKPESPSVRKTESGAEVRTFYDFPEATEACTAEESIWWKRLREAGNYLQKKSDEKSKKRFYLLMYEGQQKAYQIPVKDRAPQLLVWGEPILPEAARRSHITGTVVLSVDYRADGSVGDVQIVNGLGFGIDENIILATRKQVFLPAVKDHAFVSERSNVNFEFADKWAKKE